MSGPPPLISGRTQLLDQLDRRIALAHAHNEKLALLVINLRRFREINIRLGHANGDRVLEQVAARIRAVLRAGDQLFHIGNDEFAVILGQLKNLQVPNLASKKIIGSISENLEIAGQKLAIVARTGGAVFPDHAASRAELLQAADSALQFARDHQLNFSIYDADTRAQDIESANLRGNLRSALDNDHFQLHYQPQLNLQKGLISGCEALARWKHAELGWISPEMFIPVAEKSGDIDDLTYWSINVALRKWFEFYAAYPTASISINLSASLLHSPELTGKIEQALNIWDARPGSVVLEVTESAMMADPEMALRTLHRLHDMGITLSIDDFGTGYSSLAYLKKLPVGELKIDKSFVINMADDRQDRKIVQSVIDLAHTLDMCVVAEGIENRQALDMLIEMGCDYGQGYYISRPKPASELAEWVEASEWSFPDKKS